MNQQQPHQGQKRILAVDDEPDITRLCSLALEYYGFKVDTFNDSEEALSNFKPDHAERDKPDNDFSVIRQLN